MTQQHALVPQYRPRLGPAREIAWACRYGVQFGTGHSRGEATALLRDHRIAVAAARSADTDQPTTQQDN